MLVDAGADPSELPAIVSLTGTTSAPTTTPAVQRDGARVTRRRWVRRYRAVLVAGDVLFGAGAGAAMLAIRPGALTAWSAYGWLAAVLPLLWPVAVALCGAYQPTFFGTGSEEFRRVTRAGLLLLAGVSVVSDGAKLDIARSFVVFTIPAITLATLVGRYAARKWLHRARYRGRCVRRVVAVGRDGAVADLVLRLHKDRYAGMDVVAACVAQPGAAGQVAATGVPVWGGLDDVLEVVRRSNADAVAVTSASETAAVYLRRLSWELEGSGIELLVSPGLVEIAGPRLHVRPFVGLPLLSIEEPVFSGWKRVLKGALDRVGAALLLILIAPVFLAIALAVALTSRGPVLYRHERVGAHGRLYTMYKFRSMVEGADAQLQDLLAFNEGHGLLFKMRHDPRVTPVGRWLRRFSLDELPQLLNVLRGEMSLVGPRPLPQRDFERLEDWHKKRYLVLPGITGLWQVSGRSELNSDDLVRLDFLYLERWSILLDLLILLKTIPAVFSRRGAF